jgi:hypothetical protein
LDKYILLKGEFFVKKFFTSHKDEFAQVGVAEKRRRKVKTKKAPSPG